PDAGARLSSRTDLSVCKPASLPAFDLRRTGRSKLLRKIDPIELVFLQALALAEQADDGRGDVDDTSGADLRALGQVGPGEEERDAHVIGEDGAVAAFLFRFEAPVSSGEEHYVAGVGRIEQLDGLWDKIGVVGFGGM